MFGGHRGANLGRQLRLAEDVREGRSERVVGAQLDDESRGILAVQTPGQARWPMTLERSTPASIGADAPQPNPLSAVMSQSRGGGLWLRYRW